MPVNRGSPYSDLFRPGEPALLTPVQIRALQRKLDRAVRKAVECHRVIYCVGFCVETGAMSGRERPLQSCIFNSIYVERE